MRGCAGAESTSVAPASIYPMIDQRANILPSIPGDFIARAASALPDASTTAAPGEERRQLEIQLDDGRRVRITFQRFKHKRGKTTPWFWTADHTQLLNERTG